MTDGRNIEGLPVIPETITVHLGAPGADTQNVTVSFVDYIKNVASSEVYPTWPENALRANILSQISFALNRIYTEYYRSRGYDFDITNSTTDDQAFVYGRDIFENISALVDELFDQYIRRQGSVEPLFAQYCNGSTVFCQGLSQWGSVSLAETGYTPYGILTYYYGDDIDIVRDAPTGPPGSSYPGRILRLGSAGDDVLRVQLRLNRISKNYAAIPKIPSPDGIFGTETERAVRAFQEIFSLDPDALVGPATWNAILRIYGAVKRLSDLNSEGIPLSDLTSLFQSTLEEGDEGIEVLELQYLLDFVANFLQSVPSVARDGIFGSEMKAAVEAFQAEYGLPVTGVVDTATWDVLYRAYRGMYATLPEGYFSAVTAPYPGYPIREGSEGEEVRLIQTYLKKIATVYREIPMPEETGVFGPATTAAVRAYQTLFGMPVTGIVSARTWNAVTDTYRAILEGEDTSPGQYGGELGQEGV